MRSIFLSRIALTMMIILLSTTSCVKAYVQSVGGEIVRSSDRIFLTDLNTAWQSILDALKNSQIDIANKEGGYIQTKWRDNTSEKNFSDSFGGAQSYLKAQYRFKITTSVGFHNDLDSVKIQVLKEQLIQKDVLEGWRPTESDNVDENTLLYRIGRMIFIRMKLASLDEQKIREDLEDSKL